MAVRIVIACVMYVTAIVCACFAIANVLRGDSWAAVGLMATGSVLVDFAIKLGGR